MQIKTKKVNKKRREEAVDNQDEDEDDDKMITKNKTHDTVNDRVEMIVFYY